jgi:hypothetical protein
MNIQTPVILTIASLAISLPNGVSAEELTEAKVTQVVQDVKVLPSNAAPRPASVNETVRQGSAVQTGVQSRSELTFKDQTITRLGEKTIFSVGQGARTIDLGSGQFLLYVPKKAGGAKIKMGPVTAAITGTTVLGNYDPSGLTTFVVLEGGACMQSDMGQSIYVGPGQQVTYDPITGRLEDPVDVDLNQTLASPLVRDFRQLPSAGLIQSTMRNQQAMVVDNGELAAAVRAAGASSIATATDEQFMHALNSVLVRVPPGAVCGYVGAAVRARPDLADRIVVASLGVYRIGPSDFNQPAFTGREINCDEANCFVQAGCAADPSACSEIVDAVVTAYPLLRGCIAIPCPVRNAFRQPVIDSPTNPANFVPPVVSPEQPVTSANE